MRELTEVNAVTKDVVNFPQETTNRFAIRTLHLKSFSSFSHFATLFSQKGLLILLSFFWRHLSHFQLELRVLELTVLLILISSLIVDQNELAEFAKQLAAMLAFFGIIREVIAHDASNFLDHLPLELILNGWQLNVKLGDGFGAHDLFYCFIRDEQFWPFFKLGHPGGGGASGASRCLMSLNL